MIRSRVSAYRMRYAVDPGLYAAGSPDRRSDVFVTANYKLSFDILRQSLAGMDAWVLVLDTKSINVWCAAGKGTFGTAELVRRIAETRLGDRVDHRTVIVPQLGAVGVNAAAVLKQTRFRVRFGPVEARDIPAYVKSGYRKTAEMSTARFTLVDRLVLTPMELNPALKKYPWFASGVLLLFGIRPEGILFQDAWSGGLPFLLLGLIMIATGAFLTPILLPYLPFRSFAVKGWIAGLLVLVPAIPVLGPLAPHDPVLVGTVWLLFPALSSYLALQFTGSTTFTSMSGVKKELKIGLPVYFSVIGVSLVLLVIYKLKAWGLV
jgi:hypothetical protein